MTTKREKMAEFEPGYYVNVTGRHVQVTEGMKQHAINKLSKLDRLGARIIDVNVTMDIQKLEHRVDIIVKYGHTVVKSHAASSDMYVSIDKAVEKLQNQISRYKNKIQDHHAKGHPVVEMPMKVYGIPLDEVAEINDEIETESHKRYELHTIQKVESQPLKILTDEEAIMKMELSHAPVMVYRDEKDRRLKVIWRLENGNYGVIEPEQC